MIVVRPRLGAGSFQSTTTQHQNPVSLRAKRSNLLVPTHLSLRFEIASLAMTTTSSLFHGHLRLNTRPRRSGNSGAMHPTSKRRTVLSVHRQSSFQAGFPLHPKGKTGHKSVRKSEV